MFPQNPNTAGKNSEASEQKPIIDNSGLERNCLNSLSPNWKLTLKHWIPILLRQLSSVGKDSVFCGVQSPLSLN